MYAVILAGGEGTRLWPLSRPDRPKPFLALLGPTTLLQRTVARLSPLVDVSDVYVVTDRRYEPLVREQLPELPLDNLLGEPMGRNTAAAIALAAVAIARPDDEPMLVLPADHQVLDEPGFRAALAAAAAAASGAGAASAAGAAESQEAGIPGPALRPLVTLGVTPTGPETGYGYIVAKPSASETSGRPVFEVDRFVEKPDVAGAQALLATGLAAWNSGIFVWTRRAICGALDRYAADIVGPIERALSAAGAGAISGPTWSSALSDVYPSLRAKSIDYAVMEAASLAGEVRVIPIDVGWSDLGSWSALREAWVAEEALLRGDATTPTDDHVVGSGTRMDIDSSRSLVLARDRLVVTIGLRDIIVVDTPDALLVCASDRSQDVRRVAEELSRPREDGS